jgi:hypothetical protein
MFKCLTEALANQHQRTFKKTYDKSPFMATKTSEKDKSVNGSGNGNPSAQSLERLKLEPANLEEHTSKL